MKKILALTALMAVAPAFAAHNTFTFQVNSSGADVYVCGFSLANNSAIYNEKFATGAFPQYTGSSVSWDEQTVDTWSGEVKKTQSFNENVKVTYDPKYGDNGAMGVDVYRDYQTQLLGSAETYKRISKLAFNLSEEHFGDSFSVTVCYNVPLFMDLSKVKFDVTMNAQFENMLDEGRNYLKKAHIVPSFMVAGEIVNGEETLGGGYDTFDSKADMANGNVTYGASTYFYEFPTLPNEAVVTATYDFYESATGKRPHLKHGGDFTLTTDFVPVAK